MCQLRNQCIFGFVNLNICPKKQDKYGLHFTPNPEERTKSKLLYSYIHVPHRNFYRNAILTTKISISILTHISLFCQLRIIPVA